MQVESNYTSPEQTLSSNKTTRDQVLLTTGDFYYMVENERGLILGVWHIIGLMKARSWDDVLSSEDVQPMALNRVQIP